MEEKHQPILILYYKPSCPYSQKVLQFLKENETKIPMENIEENSKAKEKLFHLGGKSQVPCLFIDGAPLYEANDIIDYLKTNKTTLL